MTRFGKRSEEKELLDAEHIPPADLYQNLRELDVINRLLGGHKVTLDALRQLRLSPDKTYSILDIGSGGGDTLKAVARWAGRNNINVELTGVDLKDDCIRYAEQFCRKHENIRFVRNDYRNLVNEENRYDIIITSLFCHHLSQKELGSLFRWGSQQARVAFIMNDLHRHPLAYYSIALLTRLFSRSRLVKNDAKLSVLRGFSLSELRALLSQAGITQGILQWKWAFRWLLVIKPAIQQ